MANFEPHAHVSVCILSFNRKDKLFHGLVQMQNLLDYPEHLLEYLVVDNGSSDDTPAMLTLFESTVRVIKNTGNVGIGAWNQAFQQAKGEYVLLTDDDAYVTGDNLTRAVEILDKDPQVAVVSLRPVNPDTGLDFHMGYPTGEMSFWGCCAVVRKSAVQQVGGLYDPFYFFQAFELDLSMRLRQAGWKIVFPGDLVGWHLTTLDTAQTPMKFYFSRRNLVVIACRYFSGRILFLTLWRLIKLTWIYGRGYSLFTKLKALGMGAIRGFKKRGRPLPAHLQEEYFHHFAEFQPASLQLSMWSDRSWWRERPAQYPRFEYEWDGRKGGRESLLIFTHRFNTDGATLMVLKAIESAEFRAQFSRIKVVSNYEGPQRRHFEALGCETLVFPFEVVRQGDAGHLVSSVEFELRHLMSKFDRVWINTIDHPAHLFEIADQVGIRGLVFGHESLAEDSPVLHTVSFGERKKRAMARLAAKGDIRIVFPSISTVAHANHRLDIDSVLRLPYGIERDEAPAYERYETMSEIRFLVTGWFCFRKNQSTLRHVFRRLHEITKDDEAARPWKVTFVGTHYSNREYWDFMERCLEDIPAERLTFLAMMNNVEMLELMRQHHFVVIPSLGEALCVSAMEMMSTGGIVIHSDCEGHEELIQDDESGFLFERNDFNRLTSLLAELVVARSTRHDSLAAMGRRAYDLVAEFSMDRYVENLISVLRTGALPRDGVRAGRVNGQSMTVQ